MALRSASAFLSASLRFLLSFLDSLGVASLGFWALEDIDGQHASSTGSSPGSRCPRAIQNHDACSRWAAQKLTQYTHRTGGVVDNPARGHGHCDAGNRVDNGFVLGNPCRYPVPDRGVCRKKNGGACRGRRERGRGRGCGLLLRSHAVED